MRFLIILLLVLIRSICFSQDCGLPKHFSSYREAHKAINEHNFEIDESDYSPSSWIQSAHYKSCVGEIGYFLMYAKTGKSYIFRGMPIEVWNGYKYAPSKGQYYNYYIDGRYGFSL